MNAYSEDLRRKIVEALSRGRTKSETARAFSVSRSSVKRYAKLVEQAFSKINSLLRRVQARTRALLIEAMGRALDAVTVRDARGFFRHCGYRPMDQLL